MSEAGYTLAETLTALTMLGLAMGGVAIGLQAIGRMQYAASEAVATGQASRAAQADLEALLRTRIPYGTHEAERFSGGARSFQFECAAAGSCEASLTSNTGEVALHLSDASGEERLIRLRTAGEPRFVYQGLRSVSPTWPPIEAGRQPLRAISVVTQSDAGERVVLVARLWSEQPRACDYDPVLRDCR